MSLGDRLTKATIEAQKRAYYDRMSKNALVSELRNTIESDETQKRLFDKANNTRSDAKIMSVPFSQCDELRNAVSYLDRYSGLFLYVKEDTLKCSVRAWWTSGGYDD